MEQHLTLKLFSHISIKCNQNDDSASDIDTKADLSVYQCKNILKCSLKTVSKFNESS